MRRIQLWRIDGVGTPNLKAVPVDELEDTDTERQFEDLLVASPDLLAPGLRLIARQLPTQNGPLDLVGVDADGRLVVFELKRGTLTREAVAQIVDYASDLAGMDPERFAKSVEQHGARSGIEPIDGFLEWFRGQFPDVDTPLADRPRMVLVGLGADERATRMVNFLADAGVDIQILTFHAFRSNAEMFLGRQVESVATKPRVDRGGSKNANLKILLENASALGVRELLQQVGDYIDERLPSYRWPNKTAFSYALQARTPEGRPTWRNYMTLYLTKKQPPSLLLMLSDRTAQVAPEAVRAFRAAVPETHESRASGVSYELPISVETWSRIREPLDRFLGSLSKAAQESLDQVDTPDQSPSGGTA